MYLRSYIYDLCKFCNIFKVVDKKYCMVYSFNIF